jgi:hypothetical protein
MPPSDAAAAPIQSTQVAWTDQDVLALLANQTYDQVRVTTGWSRGDDFCVDLYTTTRPTEAYITASLRKSYRTAVKFDIPAPVEIVGK